MKKRKLPTVIATNGKQIEVGYLRSMPEKLTRFDNLDKVEYKISQGQYLTETHSEVNIGRVKRDR